MAAEERHEGDLLSLPPPQLPLGRLPVEHQPLETARPLGEKEGAARRELAQERLGTLGAPAVTRMRSKGATSLQPTVPSKTWILTLSSPISRMRWIAWWASSGTRSRL